MVNFTWEDLPRHMSSTSRRIFSARSCPISARHCRNRGGKITQTINKSRTMVTRIGIPPGNAKILFKIISASPLAQRAGDGRFLNEIPRPIW
jgi:hypothetical protein